MASVEPGRRTGRVSSTELWEGVTGVELNEALGWTAGGYGSGAAAC